MRRYEIKVREKGRGHVKAFTVNSDYALGWFVHALKQKIEDLIK